MAPIRNSARSYLAPPTIPTCNIGSAKVSRSAFGRRRSPEQELIALSKETGRELNTAAGARELRDIELRLRIMDRLGIDVQILFNTMWIARVADKPDAEIALCGSWNRWMADHVEGRQKSPALFLRRAGDDAQRSGATNARRQGERRRGGQPAALRE